MTRHQATLLAYLNRQTTELKLVIANINWYSSVSSQKSIPPRCPYANVDRCPRYYKNLSLLGNAGITTAIAQLEENRLFKKWKKSEHWPKVKEHESSIWNNKDFHNFCPEVAYDIFGLFASELHHYADETDIDIAHKQLSKQSAPSSDWRWQWANMTPLHYSECRLYSLLGSAEPDLTQKTETNEIFEAKPGVAGFTVNIKEIIKRIRMWICSRRKG